MADSQGVPVFLRHYQEAEPQFLGRFPTAELVELVQTVQEHGCFYGDDITTDVTTQFICYDQGTGRARRWTTGFEIILGLTD